jgi:uncharacterized protein YutE (UPF0331/DUF86 family)
MWAVDRKQLIEQLKQLIEQLKQLIETIETKKQIKLYVTRKTK